MSDQAERIAIEIFYRIKGAVFMGGLPTYDKLPPYVRAEVDVIACLIRSHSAPRELVDVVTDLLTIIDAEIDQSTWRKDSPFAVALNNARVALSGREPKEARP